jgi:tRNA-modifying protein YgfZ
MAVEAPPDIESGYRYLREEAGVVRHESWRLIEVRGPDAVEFLQGQVTNDVASLEPGEGCYALLLNPKGRILADMRILMRSKEELWLDGEAAPMETVLANLKMYKVGRQVDISPIPPTDRHVISVIGPKVAAAGLQPPPAEHAFVEGELNGARALVVATDMGMDLIFDSRDAAPIEEAIREAFPDVPEKVAEILRIERGRPRFGVDMSDENLPGELGLEERAVSFTKGCYVGQEPVARMHHRGHPNRHLRGLALSKPAAGGEPVASGDGDGGSAEVGRIGSAAVSPTFGPIALSLIRREVEIGAQVLAGGTLAEVVALPFESD